MLCWLALRVYQSAEDCGVLDLPRYLALAFSTGGHVPMAGSACAKSNTSK